jgi:uncharacterized membrane protein
VALIVVAAVVAGYYLVYKPQPEPYNSISLLDPQKQTVNYPEVLSASNNSTFSVYVNVENHMNTDQNYQVQTKITKNLPATFPNGLETDPVHVYDFSLADGKTHQNLVTVTEDEPGNYSVVFELWRIGGSGAYEFTQNYCVLNIQVI